MFVVRHMVPQTIVWMPNIESAFKPGGRWPTTRKAPTKARQSSSRRKKVEEKTALEFVGAGEKKAALEAGALCQTSAERFWSKQIGEPNKQVQSKSESRTVQ